MQIIVKNGKKTNLILKKKKIATKQDLNNYQNGPKNSIKQKVGVE